MSTYIVVFLRLLLLALSLLILGRVLLSWTNPRYDGALGRFLYETTEPILAPVRRVLPQTGFVDLAPLVVLLVLGMLMRLLWLG